MSWISLTMSDTVIYHEVDGDESELNRHLKRCNKIIKEGKYKCLLEAYIHDGKIYLDIVGQPEAIIREYADYIRRLYPEKKKRILPNSKTIFNKTKGEEHQVRTPLELMHYVPRSVEPNKLEPRIIRQITRARNNSDG